MSIFDLMSGNQVKPIQTRKLTPIETLKSTIQPPEEKVQPPSLSSALDPLLDKVETIKTYLNATFVERQDVIDQLFITLATGSNLLLLGPPGTGKSHLITALTKQIEGARLFSWLLNRSSDPGEIVGPFSLKGMEEDKFVRVATGKLPEAEIVFLDEIFKSNEPTLNILLSLINEKIFYNGPTPIPVPLISLFAASNEFPESDQGLEAIYDRLAIRMWVDYIKAPANRLQLLQLATQRGTPAYPTCSVTLSLDEIKTLQQTCKAVTFHPMVLNHLNAVATHLIEEGYPISDRRLVKCLDVMKAHALLNRRQMVYTDDLASLVYVLWEKEEDFESIKTYLLEKAMIHSTEFSRLQRDLQTIQDNEHRIMKKSANDKKIFYVQVEKQLKQMGTDFNLLYKQIVGQGLNPHPYLIFKEALKEYGIKFLQQATTFQ